VLHDHRDTVRLRVDGDDHLVGGATDDLLDGGDGNDELDGAGGFDSYIAKDGRTDVIVAGTGMNDMLRDELGTSPSPQTEAVFLDILRGDSPT